MIESKYSFQKSPFFEGVIELVKDGIPCICPKAAMGLIPHPTIDNRVQLIRPACNKNCPFFVSAQLTKKGGTGATRIASGKTEPGYVLQCSDRPHPIIVDETPLKKMDLIK